MAPVGTPFALYIKTNCVKDAGHLARLRIKKRRRKENREKESLDVKV